VIAVNLIPAGRRRAKAQRHHLHKWTVRLGCYAIALLMLCFVRMSRTAGTSEVMGAQSRQLTAAIETHTRALQLVNEELTAARQKLQSLQLVGKQPDWSLLLRLTADQMGDNVVMETCSLRHVAAAGPEAERARQALVFEMTGVARSEKDVSDFVLKLEKCGLFREVKHVNTSQRTFHEQKAFSFHLKCRLAVQQEEQRT